MQIQPYSPPEPRPQGERIQIGSGGRPANPPSLLAVFGREILKRRALLIVWLVVTAGLIGLAAFKLAKPVYRAEGKLKYVPNYRSGPNAVYNPPNIQTVAQILKTPDVMDPVRQKHLPETTADEFAKNVRFEVVPRGEIIEVSFDHASPTFARTIAADLIDGGIRHFDQARGGLIREAVTAAKGDLDGAKAKLRQAEDDLQKATAAKGFVDLDAETRATTTAIGEIEAQLRTVREREASLKEQIKFQTAKRDAPPDPKDGAVDESALALVQQRMNQLQADLANEKMVEDAKIELEAARKKAARIEPLVERGILPQSELDDVVAKVRSAEATLKRWKEKAEQLKELQKMQEDLKAKSNGGRVVRRDIIVMLDQLNKELAGIPAAMESLNRDLTAKKKHRDFLEKVRQELVPKAQARELAWKTVENFSARVTEAENRTKDSNADDLKVHARADVGSSPYSTNVPKLAAAILGVSALLFLGYIGLFAIPQLRTNPEVPQAVADSPVSRPPALIALVPYTQPSNHKAPEPQALESIPLKAPEPPPEPPPSAPAPTPVPAEPAPVSRVSLPPVLRIGDLGAKPAVEPARAPAAEPPPRTPTLSHSPVQSLAERIQEEHVDRGSIVLFAPIASQLQVTPVVGDLSQFFGQKGERILVFDARSSAEVPNWVGDGLPVTEAVARYLDGATDRPADCFVPTQLTGVEYSKADLSQQVSGVVSAHRFRQLVEEMRERYSLVFMVTPPVQSTEEDPLLATLAAGMVLVTEATARPEEVLAYVESLSRHASTPVYGTLGVPRA